MAVKNYVTDESCPKCGEYILVQLRNHVYTYGGGDFTTQCPKCNSLLDIVVEPVPTFNIEVSAAQQSVHPTVATVAAQEVKLDARNSG